MLISERGGGKRALLVSVLGRVAILAQGRGNVPHVALNLGAGHNFTWEL